MMADYDFDINLGVTGLEQLKLMQRAYNDIPAYIRKTIGPLKEMASASWALDKASGKNILTLKALTESGATLTKEFIKQKNGLVQYGREVQIKDNIEKKNLQTAKQLELQLKKDAQALRVKEQEVKKLTQAQAKLEKDEAIAYAQNQKMMARQNQGRSVFDSKSTSEQLKNANSAAGQLFMTLQSIERVVTFFLIRRAMFEFLTMVSNSIIQVKELHTAIAEIRTISQSTQSTFSNWEASIRRISDALGTDLTDTARGYYQAISNQMGQGAEQTEAFMKSAAMFAKVTHSTVEEAVNTLSGSINAYNLKVTDATKVSAILFRMIDKGRVTASELGNFGGVEVLAAQLGVALEDVAAMMALISSKGVTAANTMTMLRGVFQAIAKPSKEMQLVFKELGVNGPEQLFKVYGVMGTFQKLLERTGGSAMELAEVFRNIRPAMGMTAILNDIEGFKKVRSTFDSVGDSYKRAFEDQFKSSGEQLILIQNQMRNMFSRDFGSGIVNAVANMSSAFDSTRISIDGTKEEVKGLVSLVKSLGEYALVAGGLFLTFKSASSIKTSFMSSWNSTPMMGAIKLTDDLTLATQRAATASERFGNVLKGFSPTLVFLGVSLFIDNLIKMRRAIDDGRASLENFVDQLHQTKIKDIIDKDAQAIRDLEEAARKSFQGTAANVGYLSEALANLNNKDYITELQRQFEEAGTSIKDSLDHCLDKFKTDLDTLKDDIDSYKDKIKDVDSEIKKVNADIAKVRQNDTERLQKTQMSGMADPEKVAYLKAQLPSMKAAISTSDDPIRTAEKYKDVVQEILTLEAKINGAKAKQKEANDKAIVEAKKQLESAKKTEDARKKAFDASEARARRNAKDKNAFDAKERRPYTPGTSESRAQQKLDELEAKSQTINAMPEDEIDVVLQTRLIREASDLAENALNAQKLGLEAKRLEFEAAQSKAQIDFDSRLAELKKIRDETPEIFASAYNDYLNKLTKKTAEQIRSQTPEQMADEYAKGLGSQISTYNEAKSKMGEITSAAKTIESIYKSQQDYLDKQNKNLEEILKKNKAIADQKAEALAKSEENLTQLEKDLNASRVQAEGEYRKSKGVLGIGQGRTPDSLAGFGNNNDTYSIILAVIARLKKNPTKENREELSKFIPKIDEAILNYDRMSKFHGIGSSDASRKEASDQVEVLRKIKEGIGNVSKNYNDVEEATKAATISQKELEAAQLSYKNATASNLPVIIAKYQGLKEAIDAAAQAKRDLNALNGIPNPTKEAQLQAKGGMIYASRGMFAPRGTDTVPAMLTPGEFVMNASAVRKNLGRLVPMNFGGQNLPRNDNHSTTFGDINVTVSGGTSSKTTAREIARSLRNEIRHGMRW
jgi:TP901 family phage tail tape measure protein